MTLVSRLPDHSFVRAPEGDSRASPRLGIGVLGGLSLSVGDTPIPFAGRKARALMAFLAMEGQPAVTRERLAGLFWGESSERHARNSLRQTLFELSAALSACGCGVLQRRGEELWLDRAGFSLDLDTLLASLAEGELPAALLGAAPGLDMLLAGYEDLSPDVSDWIATARRRAHNQVMQALERVYTDEQRPPPTRRSFAEAALRLDPLQEAAARIVMRLSAEAGETGVALRCYATLYEAMGLQLDSEPSEATQALVAQIKLGQVTPAEPVPQPRPPGSRTLGSMPVVAVLPLKPIGADPTTDWIAGVLAEDLVRILSGLREPGVISSSSTRNLRTDSTDLSGIGEQLGVGYLLCGSVRLAGQKGRISVELVDAPSGAVLWGDAYDIGIQHIFEAQDRIAASIAHALATRINAAELRRSIGHRTDDLTAYHLLLRARDLLFRLDRGSFAKAGLLIAEAIRRDPGYPAAHTAQADWFSLRIFQGWSEDTAADTEALMASAETAIRLDPYHARALALLGHNRMIAEHRYDEAEQLVDRAVAAAPNDAEVLIWSSPTCAFVGRTDDAIVRAERAILLSPQDPFLFRFENALSIAHYIADDFEQAASWGLRSWQRNPNYTSNLHITIAALAALGRFDEARPLVERYAVLRPNFRAASVRDRHSLRLPAQRDRLSERLSAAGVP